MYIELNFVVLFLIYRFKVCWFLVWLFVFLLGCLRLGFLIGLNGFFRCILSIVMIMSWLKYCVRFMILFIRCVRGLRSVENGKYGRLLR